MEDICNVMDITSATGIWTCTSSLLNAGLLKLSETFSGHLAPFVIPFILIVTSLKLWQAYVSSKDPNCKLPLPPGSMGLPLVGETINLLLKGSDFFRERSNTYGQVYKTHILGNSTIRVTGAHNVAKILQGEGTLVSSQWPVSTKVILGEGALAHSQGETHRWRREMIMRAFSPAALQSYVPGVQLIVRDYVKKWCSQGHIHGYPEARSLMFTIASKMLLGFDMQQKKKFQMLMHFEDMLTTLFSMPVPIPGIGLYKGMKARRQIVQAIEQCITARQDADDSLKHEDALALLLEAAEDSERHLSASEVCDSALEMLFAGHLPTSSAACSILMLLGSNPKVVDKITVELYDAGLLDNQRDNDLDLEKINSLQYVEQVVREVLRVAPPVGGGYRKALQTFEIDGCQIPKGWTVVYSIRETHHSSESYPDGMTFDPDRWGDRLGTSQVVKAETGFHYVPFGWGNRSCVGQRYADMLLKILIVELVRSSTWRLENGIPRMRFMPVPHPEDNLPLYFKEMAPDLRRRAFTMSW